MSRRSSNLPGDEQDLDRLLQRWTGPQPTERETRRLLHALEVRWTEEQNRQSRFHQQDMLFGTSLLLFVFVGSSLVWAQPVMGVRDWLVMVAALAAVAVILVLPGLMKFDRFQDPPGR